MYLKEDTDICVDDPDGEGKAVAVTYESNSDFKICPFHVNASFQKKLHIVVTLPSVQEVIRTLGKVFVGSNIDLKFYKKAATRRLKKLKTQATNGTVKVSKQI